MKKVVALLLSVLMIFSAFGMTLAFAADEANAQGDGEVYTVIFADYDGTIISKADYTFGQVIEVPDNPSRASTEENEYIFQGWSNGKEDKFYQKQTVPNAFEDVTYTAVYFERAIVKSPNFWQLIQSIFARINAMLEYITRIFTKNPKD
ncbi:MAG: hypothetical protein NC110_01185 [Ruminococcus sp.]|nr:hypothetical protein [Ruminococcus sp.]